MPEIKIICVCRHGNVHYQIMIRKPSAATWSLSAMGVMTMAEFDAFARGIGDAIPIERRVPD